MFDAEFNWQQSDDRCVIAGPGGQIVFVRSKDRWTHHLDLRAGSEVEAEATALVSAVESEPGLDDPTRVVSPVYQELQRHEFIGDQIRGVCVLLTGHMHQHHFSASVSFCREQAEAGFVKFEMDVADRCRARVSALAATYLIRFGSGELADAGRHAILWRGSSPAAVLGPDRLELRCDSPGSLALAEAGRIATRVQVFAAIDPTVFTHRLRYRWRWSCPCR
jgi:hypothetical protein